MNFTHDPDLSDDKKDSFVSVSVLARGWHILLGRNFVRLISSAARFIEAEHDERAMMKQKNRVP